MESISVSRLQKVDALRRNSYFAGLQPDALDQLAAGTCLCCYDSGESLFWQGEACKGLFVVKRGSVKLYKTSPKGRELIIRIIRKGETFNEVPVFDRGPVVVNAAALEETLVWRVDDQAIERCMHNCPEMAQAVIANLSSNLRTLVDMLEEMSFYQVTHRLARLIAQLSEDELEGPASKRLKQDDLAARLGTVREVVARALNELGRSGAIHTRRGKIHIVDRALLEQWAQEP